jgi:hypothetical protein
MDVAFVALNAGLFRVGPIVDVSDKDLEDVIRVNAL